MDFKDWTEVVQNSMTIGALAVAGVYTFYRFAHRRLECVELEARLQQPGGRHEVYVEVDVNNVGPLVIHGRKCIATLQFFAVGEPCGAPRSRILVREASDRPTHTGSRWFGFRKRVLRITEQEVEEADRLVENDHLVIDPQERYTFAFAFAFASEPELQTATAVHVSVEFVSEYVTKKSRALDRKGGVNLTWGREHWFLLRNENDSAGSGVEPASVTSSATE